MSTNTISEKDIQRKKLTELKGINNSLKRIANSLDFICHRLNGSTDQEEPEKTYGERLADEICEKFF